MTVAAIALDQECDLLDLGILEAIFRFLECDRAGTKILNKGESRLFWFITNLIAAHRVH
jgi:hypothetical protein